LEKKGREEMKDMSVHPSNEASAPGAASDSGDRLNVSTCMVDMRFLPKDLDHAVRLLLSVKGDILTKRGCHTCDVAREAADEGVVHYREAWESGMAFREHVRSEEFRRVLIAMDLSCEEPQIMVGTLSGHSGMAYLRNLREPDPSPGTTRGHSRS
jgi:quinol monooxygenase YgiN